MNTLEKTCFDCEFCDAYCGIPAGEIVGAEFECTFVKKNILVNEACDFTPCTFFLRGNAPVSQQMEIKPIVTESTLESDIGE